MTNWSKLLKDFHAIQHISVLNLYLFAPIKTELWAKEVGKLSVTVLCGEIG